MCVRPFKVVTGSEVRYCTTTLQYGVLGVEFSTMHFSVMYLTFRQKGKRRTWCRASVNSTRGLYVLCFLKEQIGEFGGKGKKGCNVVELLPRTTSAPKCAEWCACRTSTNVVLMSSM